MDRIDGVLGALGRSRFHSRFKLGAKEQRYLEDRGLDAVVEHAYEFIERRVAPTQPEKEGRQTPFKGHPVFVAQHATPINRGRSCLAKWHHIHKGKALSDDEVEYVVAVIRRWLERRMLDLPTPRLPPSPRLRRTKRRAGT